LLLPKAKVAEDFGGYKIYTALLTIYTVAMAIKADCKNCGRVFVTGNFNLKSFFIYASIL
jgi:hypothetical protein